MSQLDLIYRHLNDDLEEKYSEDIKSDIQEFYTGKTLFITGATGFMGKILIEKLLRSCADLKCIYILMRKKGKESIEQRLQKYFQHKIFDPLRLTYPNFANKVKVLNGDVTLDGLGLSQEDLETLISETNIIIHNAANVKFDIRVSLSLTVNVLGTKHMLDIAQKCRNLEVFIYVSSAYSHCYKKHIEEEFYPPAGGLNLVYNLIEKDKRTENGLSPEVLKEVLGEYPSVYMVTKAIAEDLVRQYAENSKSAVGIYRPSIVTTTIKEPVAGWCGNFNGPVFIMLGAGLGALHAAYHFGRTIDFIPVDMSINMLIALTWDVTDRWKKEQKPVIYNYGTSTQNPINLPLLYNYVKNQGKVEGSSKALMLNFILFTKRIWVFWIMHILFHMIPALLADAALIISGRKPLVMSGFMKATQYLDKIDYYGNGAWQIYVPESLKVIDRLNPLDREIFYCDIRDIDWECYCFIIWRGLRYYILKEDINDKKSSIRRYRLLCCMHYGTIAVFCLVVYYYLSSLINLLF